MNAVNSVNSVNAVNTVSVFRYELDRSSKKHTCPQCGKKRFVLVIDNETREFLPDHVGRCDRENGCGYEYTWSQYLKETTTGEKLFIQSAPVEEAKPVDYLPMAYLSQSIHQKHRTKNNFFLFLTGLFGEFVSADLFTKYLICTSAYWKGAALFPQIDEAGNLRQVKIMLHNQVTGKRTKEGATVERLDKETRRYLTEISQRPCSMVYGRFINEQSKNLNLVQTFFGCHLLTEFPNKPVCIVESEKTAVICSVYLPQFIWMATGGASGCKWREYETYKCLKGRSVTFFPDYGFFNLKTGKTCFEEWTERCERIREALPGTKVRVSDVLEKRLADKERQDQDLADMLLVRDEQTSFALTEEGYPVFWDYKF